MSHFYGAMKGGRKEVTRTGHRNSGLRVTAASWQGAITVALDHDPLTGEDYFTVEMHPWLGAGDTIHIAHGVVGDAKQLQFGTEKHA